MPTDDLQLGANQDLVSLKIGGVEVGALANGGISLTESYEIKVSVFQQPAAFTLRLGWGDTAAKLLQLAKPGTPFQLFIGPNVIQSGTIYSRGVPSASATQVEIKGRDYLARLFDDEVQDEASFTDKTYFQLTRKILNVVGLKEEKAGDGTRFALFGDNEANRAITSRVKSGRGKKHQTQLVQEIETGVGAGGSKLVYSTIKATLGTTYYEFLQQQFKLAGLFLWATGSGNFVLARPTADQDPAFRVLYQRGQTRKVGNAIDRAYEDDTTMRHALCVCYGRAGTGTNGRSKIRGGFVDEEMFGYGFQNVRIVHDDDVRTATQAEYIARKTIAEERRRGWKLDYTLAGHIVPTIKGGDGYGVWCPDMVTTVDDEELGISGSYYVQDVTFRRNPQTSTTISLMRPEDLVFAEGLF